MQDAIPASSVNSAHQYAERLRLDADAASDPNVKRHLLELVDRLGNLADMVETIAAQLSGS